MCPRFSAQLAQPTRPGREPAHTGPVSLPTSRHRAVPAAKRGPKRATETFSGTGQGPRQQRQQHRQPNAAGRLASTLLGAVGPPTRPGREPAHTGRSLPTSRATGGSCREAWTETCHGGVQRHRAGGRGGGGAAAATATRPRTHPLSRRQHFQARRLAVDVHRDGAGAGRPPAPVRIANQGRALVDCGDAEVPGRRAGRYGAPSPATRCRSAAAPPGARPVPARASGHRLEGRPWGRPSTMAPAEDPATTAPWRQASVRAAHTGLSLRTERRWSG